MTRRPPEGEGGREAGQRGAGRSDQVRVYGLVASRAAGETGLSGCRASDRASEGGEMKGDVIPACKHPVILTSHPPVCATCGKVFHG